MTASAASVQDPRSLAVLQDRLGYQFRDQALLQHALTHRSYSLQHNERLEFLGDSVLNLTISQLLFTELQAFDEGDLSRVRSSLVRQQALHDIAQTLALHQHLRLGEGELKSGGLRRPSILADALEALFGAIFLDGGYAAAVQVIESIYRPILRSVDAATLGKDAKTLLQEFLQGHGLPLPLYQVVATTGAAHNQMFEVECSLGKLGIAVFGSGASRRAAEQVAAVQALSAAQQALAAVPKKGRKRRSQLPAPQAKLVFSSDQTEP